MTKSSIARFGWGPGDLSVRRRGKMVRLTRVVVPPYLREKDGHIEDVSGYTYNRRGAVIHPRIASPRTGAQPLASAQAPATAWNYTGKFVGEAMQKSYVARITGKDPKFKMQREFVQGAITKGQPKVLTGATGVQTLQTIEARLPTKDGVYEVRLHRSGNKPNTGSNSTSFYRVQGGVPSEMPVGEFYDWLEDPSTIASPRAGAQALALPKGITIRSDNALMGIKRVSAFDGDKRIGFIRWKVLPNEGDFPDMGPMIAPIMGLEVDEAYQRKGIATALYNKAKEVEPRLVHHWDLSPEGKAWAATLEKDNPQAAMDAVLDAIPPEVASPRSGAQQLRSALPHLEGEPRAIYDNRVIGEVGAGMGRLRVLAMYTPVKPNFLFGDKVVIGAFSYDPVDKKAELMFVHPDWRRVGIAAELWEAANKLDGPLTQGDERTTAGKAWAESVMGKGAAGPHRKFSNEKGEHSGAAMVLSIMANRSGPVEELPAEYQPRKADLSPRADVAALKINLPKDKKWAQVGQGPVGGVMTDPIVDYEGPQHNVVVEDQGTVALIRNDQGQALELFHDVAEAREFIKAEGWTEATDLTSPRAGTNALTKPMSPMDMRVYRARQIGEADMTGLSTTRAVVSYAQFGGTQFPLGALTWDPKTKQVELVFVQNEFRRKGIARELWDAANRVAGPLKHGKERSPAGRAWAEAMGGDTPAARDLGAGEAEAMGNRLISGMWSAPITPLSPDLTSPRTGVQPLEKGHSTVMVYERGGGNRKAGTKPIKTFKDISRAAAQKFAQEAEAAGYRVVVVSR